MNASGVGRSIRQLGGETIIYGIAGTLSRMIRIFLVPLYTRVFSPADYGVIALITSTISFLTTFSIMGLDNASSRWYYDSDDPQQRKQVIASWFWTHGVTCVAIAALVSLFAPLLAHLLLGQSSYADILRIAVLDLPFSAFSRVLGNWLRYQRRAWTTMAFYTLSSLGSIGLIALFVLVFRQGLAGLYVAQVLTSAIMAGIAIFLFRSWISPGEVSARLVRELVIFGLPLIPAGVASWITASADRLILKAYYPTSEIGLYATAIGISSAVALITGAFQMAWGPFALSIQSQPNANDVYRRIFSLYSLFGSMACATLAVFAPLILRLLTTPRYYAAASSVPYLAFAALALGATYIAALGATIAKRSTVLAASIFIGAGVNTALNLLLIPPMGKDGAGLATFLAYLAAALYLFAASQRLYPIAYRFRDGLLCLGFAFALIALDSIFLSSGEPYTYAAKTGLILLFLPFGLALQIYELKHIRYVWQSLAGLLRRRAA
jgi:O-antigen/teichoic acid export membrane protein